jgi:spermidine synthase
VLAALTAAAVAVVAFSDLPQRLYATVRDGLSSLGDPEDILLPAALPAFLGFELFLVKRVARRLTVGAAITGLVLAFVTAVPAELYQRGRDYGRAMFTGAPGGAIVLFEEGAMESAVVYESASGPLELSVHGQVCASAVPENMTHLRLLGHLPALLSADPAETVVVGLGAGVSAGCLAIHDRVRHVEVVELESKIKRAAAMFAEANHHAMDDPKVRVTIDDGRHFLATCNRKFGVITSDPIEPYWMGSAALYTTEYYRMCRGRLVDGGIFMQWLGVFGIDEEGMRSLLAAFGDAFPDGQLWISREEFLLVGSTRPVVIDVAALREYLRAHPRVAASLADVRIDGVEEFLAHYICPLSALREYLAGATPNRDGNLNAQYEGWRAYYQYRPWSSDVKSMLVGRRDLSDSPFNVPSQERRAFQQAIGAARNKFFPPPATQPAE